jgi:hypothetical protein
MPIVVMPVSIMVAMIIRMIVMMITPVRLGALAEW